MLKYKESNGKFIIDKEGAFFGLTKEQVTEMRIICEEIEEKNFEQIVDTRDYSK